MQKWCDRMVVHLTNAKAALLSGAAVVGGVLSKLFGGLDTAFQTLILFMAVDYITGLVVAGVFGASDKSGSGHLESRAGWRGLCRKGVTLLIVLVAAGLDTVLGLTLVRDAAIYAFIANESISIVENAGLMGIPIPQSVINAIETLQNKGKPSEEKRR